MQRRTPPSLLSATVDISKLQDPGLTTLSDVVFRLHSHCHKHMSPPEQNSGSGDEPGVLPLPELPASQQGTSKVCKSNYKASVSVLTAPLSLGRSESDIAAIFSSSNLHRTLCSVVIAGIKCSGLPLSRRIGMRLRCDSTGRLRHILPPRSATVRILARSCLHCTEQQTPARFYRYEVLYL